MRRFELVEGTSSKFWSVGVEGSRVSLHWGRIGTAGQQKTKDFGSEAEAQKEAASLISSKLKKGYAEVASKGDVPTGAEAAAETAPKATKAQRDEEGPHRGAPTASAPTTTTATDDLLPKVLSAPPWREKNRAQILTGTVKPADVPIVCPAATGKLPHRPRWKTNYGARDLDISSPPGTYLSYFNVRVVLDPSDSIAVFGEASLPGLLEVLPKFAKNPETFGYWSSFSSYLEQYMVVGTVDLAMHFARFLDRKDVRALACQWAAKFPRHAFHGILPTLFGPPSRDREHAMAMLHELHRAKGADVLRELAKEASVEAEIDAWLSRDPLEDAPRAAGSIPKFLDLAQLPRAELKDDNGPLSDDALRNLVEMLTFATTMRPIYSGVADVKAALDPESLDRFAIALVEAWITAGARAANGWVADAIGLLGTTEVVPWLKDRLGELIAQKERAATLRMLKALLRIDTPSARMYVLKHVRHGQQAWLKREGAELLEEHLAESGTTTEDFEASAVPPMPETIDFGDGSPLLIGLDEQLRPCLRTRTGERLKRAPSAKGEAGAEWPRIKEEAEIVVKMEQARLERLTRTGETFSADSFTKRLAHPILRALAQGLVFVMHGENGRQTFRVAEDGTFADQEDAVFELEDGATISVMHPIDEDPSTLAAWGARFSDYKLVQPVEQLSREVFRLTPEESASSAIDRWSDKQVYAGKFLALRQRGWSLDAQMEGAIHGAHTKLTTTSGGEATASIYVRPPIQLHDDKRGEHTLSGLLLSVPFRELSDKAASELCLTMERLIAPTS